MKKELQRKLSFVLFVMAVFFAGTALTVFSSSVPLVCIAGVLLLAASVFYVLLQEEKNPSPTEKTTDILLADRMAELMRGNEKAEKGVYIAVKKQHEAMEGGMAALAEKLAELVKEQESAVKTLVIYNKENAKQMALSEREELGHLREELKQISQSGEAMLSELSSTADSLNEIRELLKSLGETGPVQYEMRPAAAAAKEEPAEEPVPKPAAEETPEDAFASSGVDLTDSNKTLSPEDIAALFASRENQR